MREKTVSLCFPFGGGFFLVEASGEEKSVLAPPPL